MKAQELAEKITTQGYEVKSIRVFKNSFHVNVWTPDCKIRQFYKVPLNSVDWARLKRDYPKVAGV